MDMQYTINWQNGLTDTITGTLEDAQRYADRNLAYTQESVTILDAEGKTAARRPWIPTMEYIDDCEQPTVVGDGYYSDWMDDYGICNYMTQLTKIGTIKVEGESTRYGIYWDGQTLCDAQGVEIMDGAAATLDDAKALAEHLWEIPSWDYEAE
jgi:hypothetical protein